MIKQKTTSSQLSLYPVCYSNDFDKSVWLQMQRCNLLPKHDGS